jgi:DNA-binding transcriptional LysR family regulator
VRIEQLEYVAAVARLGSFRRAAEAVHVSQPGLSEAVRSLERELGVHILERGRHGARVSESGRNLLPYILTVLESVDQLRAAANTHSQNQRVVRIGTVNTAASPLVTPTIRLFRETHDLTQVEIFSGVHADILRSLLEGSSDLGLVNYLEGDDLPPELDTTVLLTGRAVVCLRPDSPLARLDTITIAELREAPLIAMRAGYVMHRYLHRLLSDGLPALSCSADGAEMGKLMVADGLGVTVLPDFSVIGDPLESRGIITWRPLADDNTKVRMAIQRLRSGSPPEAVADLHRLFVERAREYRAPSDGPRRLTGHQLHPAPEALARPARSGSTPRPVTCRPGGCVPHQKVHPGA